MKDLIKEYKMAILFFIVAALFFFFLGKAYAGEYHHSTASSSTETTIINNQSTKGVALGIAIGQHNFDSSTFAWQGSISTGSYDDSSAFSFGLAKRFKATLISGSVATEGGKTGYGASLGFKF